MKTLRSLTAVLALLLAAAPVLAMPSLYVEAPATYTPAAPFNVQVVLSGADALASFNVELTLSGATGTAGTDFFFLGGVQPAAPQYVFDGEAAAGFLAVIPPGAADFITLSDFLTTNPAGVSTVAGLNDRIATVTVGTLATFAGEFSIAVNGPGLELDTFDLEPIDGFGDVVAALAPATVAPEPCTLALVAVAFGAAWRRRRRAS